MTQKLVVTLVFSSCFCVSVSAQTENLSNPAQRVVYPMQGKDMTLQSADEQMCYDWSAEKTSWDPQEAVAQLKEKYSQSMAQYEQSTGGALKGAAGGALMGLAIGAIAGDAGKGAAIGAAAGGGAGALRSRRGRQQAEEGFEEAVEQFQVAFQLWDRHWVACMKGNQYAVE